MNQSDVKFNRGEIVTLFNAFGRLSESIMSVQNFREFYDQEPLESQAAIKFTDFRILVGTSIFMIVLSTLCFLNMKHKVPANK